MDGVRRQTPYFSVHRRRRVRLANAFGVMVIAWILAGVSMVLATVMTFVACRWREAYYHVYGLFKKYNKFIKSGAREFSITKEIVDNDFNVGKVHVEATDGKGMSFVIKTFIVGNPHDKEDVAFAVREAEELIEIINEA